MPRVTVTTSYGDIWDTAQDGPAYIKCASALTLTRTPGASPPAGETEDAAANERVILKSNSKTRGKVASGTAVVMIYPL